MSARQALVVGLVLGAVVGAWYMHLHLTCPACQSRWAAWKRDLGRRLIE